MAAGKYDITIDQGSVFDIPMTYRDAAGAPVDMTSWTARMQVRKTAASPTLVVELTTANSRITLGNGSLSLHMADTVTATLTPGDYVYQLELDPGGGNAFRFLEGKCTISAEVTR